MQECFYIIYLHIQKLYTCKMSSSEQCTFEACHCHNDANKNKLNQFPQKRQHPYVLKFQRNDYRHHNAKRRFPPKKKEQLMKQQSMNRKLANKFYGINASQFDDKVNKIIPLTKLNQNNQVNKMSCDKTLGIEVPYHAVGHSQRQKLNSPSPQVSQNMMANAYRKAPLTDRDRRIYSKNGQIENNIDLGNNGKLDEKFLKNFANPEILLGGINKQKPWKEC